MKPAGKTLTLLALLALLGAACIPFDDARSEFCAGVDAKLQEELCTGDPNDAVAPTVVSVTPEGSEADANAPIAITFSEPMSQASFSSSFSVRRGEAPIAGSVRVEGTTATFTSVPGLALLGEYSVSVTRDAKDLAGNPLVDGRRWTFRTRDGAWGAPSSLETSASGLGPRPRIATNDSGQVVAVWTRTKDARDDLWASIYTPARGWSAPEQVEFNDIGTVSDPQVAVDVSGNAHVVWAQRDSSVFSIWATRYVAGSGWTTPRLLEEINTADALSPRLTVNASGAAVALWQQREGTLLNLWSNRFVPGVGWGTAERVRLLEAGLTEPQVALGADGSTIALWLQAPEGRPDVFASIRAVDGTWSVPEAVESENQGPASAPMLAVDAAGNALVVWLQSDGSTSHVWANRYVPGTGWGSSRRLDSQAGGATRPSLAVRPGGEALAVWSQQETSGSHVWVSRYVPGTGWDVASRVSVSDTGGSTLPSVAIDPSGNALAVWVQQHTEGTGLASRRYLADGGWGTVTALKLSPAAVPESPSLVMDARGIATVVWKQRESSAEGFWAARRE
jgi:Bacterial Ig-like domain